MAVGRIANPSYADSVVFLDSVYRRRDRARVAPGRGRSTHVSGMLGKMRRTRRPGGPLWLRLCRATNRSRNKWLSVALLGTAPTHHFRTRARGSQQCRGAVPRRGAIPPADSHAGNVQCCEPAASAACESTVPHEAGPPPRTMVTVVDRTLLRNYEYISVQRVTTWRGEAVPVVPSC